MKTSSWKEVPLEAIAAPSRYPIGDGDHGAIKPSMYATSGIPYIRVADIANGEIQKAKLVYISRSVHRDNPKSHLFPNDILISKTGATIGKVAIIPPDIEEANTTSSVGKITIDPKKALPRFVVHYLRSPRFQAAMWAVSHKSAQPGFNIKDLKQFRIPLPTLAEQEGIVKLLDEVDELRKLRAQADRRTADLIPALFHEMFGENTKKPLARVRLEQIAEVVSGVAKGRKFNGRLPVEVPYLRVANVQAGHLDLSEIKTIQALPEEVEELALQKGDVLLTEGGDFDKLGRGAMLEQDLPNCIHQNHVFRVRVEQSKLNPVYLARFLLTGEARGYFLGCAKRTTNLASINMTQLRALPVHLPPLTLQNQFAARVSEIRAVQDEQSASHRRLDELFQSMLHRAFNGEL